MKKSRCLIFFLIICLLCSTGSSFACDESQTNTYLDQLLFGDEALSKANDADVKKLHSALYLCSEQCDGQGQEKIDYLKSQKVSGIPELSKIDIKNNDLLACSHNSWEYEYKSTEDAQIARKKLLQKTVNDVFDFGFISNHFGSSKGKCNSFAAMLYYTHILSDYLADAPKETAVNVNGQSIPSYIGSAYKTIYGDKPSFTTAQKKSTQSDVKYSPLDSKGRAGTVFSIIGIDTIDSVGPLDKNKHKKIKPTGLQFDKYPGLIKSSPAYLYNRCHLLGRQLGGKEIIENYISGTRYLNAEDGMEKLENDIAKYIKRTRNHVLYRVTPIFQGDNLIASGLQIEAFSVEDGGKGISCNRYYYNVQPGININYSNGKSYQSDKITDAKYILEFAVENAGEDNPDLIYEMNEHLAVVFEDQKDTSTYNSMQNEIKTIANEARKLKNDNKAARYLSLKQYEYEYLDVLKSYVPLLLKKEEFYKSAFK